MIIYSELKDDFNAFLKANALWICLVLVGIILITLAVILILNKKPKKKEEPLMDLNRWLKALGEKENIKSIEATGSRLSLTLVNQELVNQEELKALGVNNIIKMSNKLILVIENKAEQIKNELEAN